MVDRNTPARVVALLAVALAAWVQPAAAQQVQWDAEASQDLEAALHHMHHVWNSGDIESLKSIMIGDEQLESFELDPGSHHPILLSSKTDIDQFIDEVVEDITVLGARVELEEPVVNCRATGGWGVCTERCTINTYLPDGQKRSERLWSTAVAVRENDAWRWVQWHMSRAGDEAGEIAAETGDR